MQAILTFANKLLTGTLFDATPKTDEEKKAAIEKMFSKYKKWFPNVDDIDAAQLKQELEEGDDNLVVVDCRPEDERVSIIPNAIPEEQLETSNLPANAKVVVYCTVGYRSGLAGKKIKENNPSFSVRNLKGGILLWCHESGTQVVDDCKQPTKTVHVYGKTWSLLPQEYDPVMGPRSNLTHL